MLPASTGYNILIHDSKSCVSLQVVDYCNWAVHRKWRDGDLKAYNRIAPAVKSEFDIFRTGRTLYY
jgi:hypothetical protein